MKARLLLALFSVSLAFNASRIVGPLDWRMLLAALAAWWTADLLSGVVHMWMDYRPCVTGVGLKELYFWEGSRESDVFHESSPLDSFANVFRLGPGVIDGR